MTIEITEGETQLLRDMCEAEEKELIAGIDHADTREYRKRLQERLRSVESLHGKVLNLAESDRQQPGRFQRLS